MGLSSFQIAIVQIYNLVRRHKGLTRSEIARQTGLARSTISLQINELLQKGLVREQSDRHALRKLKIEVESKRGYFLGGLLGTKRFSAQLVDLSYQLVLQRDFQLTDIHQPQGCNEQILQFLRTMVEESGLEPAQLWGLGLGFPFPVDFASGKPDSPPYVPLWDGFPLLEFYQDGLGLPTLIDNDVNVMAWGEVMHTPTLDHTLFVKIGTGIGCGIVLHHQLYRGAKGAAGDIGHISVPGETVPCHCGHIGCLEAVAGAKAIDRATQELANSGKSPFLAQQKAHKLRTQDLIAGANAGDLPCILLLQEKGEKIGEALSSMVNAFNPDTIVIGGGVSNNNPHLLHAVRQRIFYRAPHLATIDLHLQSTHDPVWVGSLGAAALIGEHILHQHFYTRILGRRHSADE